ncbi:MAG TPA: hypothetical protein PLS03_18385, partial [Terrimicrobiaceae bacterium]|nr:hypothetical protein [Terrimicrobiaceae bacterium]
MLIRHHFPGITTSPWIANNPIQPAGPDGLEAYYSSLWSHPALLRAGGGFPKIVRADAPRSAESELHLVTLIGAQNAPALAAVLPGERIFIDGLSQDALSPNGAALPRHARITSLKERLATPAGEFLIPENLPLGVWTEVPEGWSGMGDRDGTAFYLFSRDVFLSPVNSAHVDFILRRDKGRTAWNWRYYLAAALSRWLGLPEEHFAVEPGRERDLRDAFSAFGFHRWVVLKTAEKLGADAELSSAEAAVMEAAEDLHGRRWDKAERLLQAGFDGLKERLDALTGAKRRYFAEAHHGGMLHEDIGFYEHDWPQMVCDTLREFMACKGVTASLDMPANVYRHYRERFPSFFRELRLWMEQGRIELVNGMFGQPLSDSHTLENLLSQLIEGRRELRELFGREPEVFAMEEYSLGPAIPQILEAAGIRKAVHAVRLGGTSKANSPATRLWRGIGNGSVECIEHPDVGHPGLSTTYFLQLPETLAQSGRLRRNELHLFNLPDFGWNVLFRDEVFAGLQFGPILFEMVTFQKLFRLLPKKADEAQGHWEDTY